MKAKTEKISIAFKYPLAPDDRGAPVPNELLDRMLKEKLELRELKLLLFLFGETYGACRLDASVSYTAMSKGTRISEKYIGPTIKKLQRRGLIDAN